MLNNYICSQSNDKDKNGNVDNQNKQDLEDKKEQAVVESKDIVHDEIDNVIYLTSTPQLLLQGNKDDDKKD